MLTLVITTVLPGAGATRRKPKRRQQDSTDVGDRGAATAALPAEMSSAGSGALFRSMTALHTATILSLQRERRRPARVLAPAVRRHLPPGRSHRL